MIHGSETVNVALETQELQRRWKKKKKRVKSQCKVWQMHTAPEASSLQKAVFLQQCSLQDIAASAQKTNITFCCVVFIKVVHRVDINLKKRQ